MAKYYHGTSKQTSNAIRANGLRPNRNINGEEPQPFAFLSSSKRGARAFAGKNGDVLEVDPPKRIERKFRTNLGEFIRSPVHIPRQYIKKATEDED